MAAKRTCHRSSSGNSKNCEAGVDPAVTNGAEEEHCLIPGIPDEITVCHILAKLPWTAMFPISRVNNMWRRLIKSRKVFDARVMDGCTQSLVPIMHRAPMYGTPMWNGMTKVEGPENEAMSLFDPVIGSWNLLPPVPPLVAGIPKGCGCVCLNGKVYILGGLHAPPRADLDSDGLKSRLPSLDYYGKASRKEVYSLDLAAGDTTWKRCADMTCARAWFHCGVQDGNIYVFWGVNQLARTAVLEVEVYDPEEDLWDLVAPTPYPDIIQYSAVKTFTAVGETFVIHSYFRGTSRNLSLESVEHTYDTSKDEWKVVHHMNGDTDPTSASVTMNQNVYTIDPKTSKLEIYNETSTTCTSASSSVIWKFLNPRVEPMPFRPYLPPRSCSPIFYNIFPYDQLDCSRHKSKNVREVLALAAVNSDLKHVTLVGLTRTTDVVTHFRTYPDQLALFTGPFSLVESYAPKSLLGECLLGHRVRVKACRGGSCSKNLSTKHVVRSCNSTNTQIIALEEGCGNATRRRRAF